jgi:hypothetical protein
MRAASRGTYTDGPAEIVQPRVTGQRRVDREASNQRAVEGHDLAQAQDAVADAPDVVRGDDGAMAHVERFLENAWSGRSTGTCSSAWRDSGAPLWTRRYAEARGGNYPMPR